MTALPVLTTTEFSTELERQVDEPVDGHPLWASRFLVTNKNACLAAYKQLIRSGAGLIQTNTYQASPEAFARHMGLSEAESLAVFRESVHLCKRALLEEERPDIIIGGSIGSVDAWRADGSEYSGKFCALLSREEYIDKHRPRFQALVEGGVTFMCLETLPCSLEALSLIDLLKEYPNLRGWVSFFGRNSKEISSGEIFADVAIRCWARGKGQLVGVGVNCLDPAWVAPLYMSLKEADPSVPFVAYPNSGEKYDTLTKSWTACETPKSVAEYIPEWLDLGVAHVGGCCRNTADDLKDMKKAVDRWMDSRRTR